MTDVPTCYCLDCGTELNAVTDPIGDAKPSPGDITLCLRCAHIMAFADDLSVRALTDEEMRHVAGNKTVLKLTAAIRAVKEGRQ